MTSNHLILGLSALFFSAMLQGITGFGFCLLAVPLLSLFISPKTLIPIMLLLSIPINIGIIISDLKAIDLNKILLILVGAILGIPLGTYFLVYVDEAIIKMLIGFLIITFGGLLFFGFQKNFKNENIPKLIIGFVSGILGGAVAMSGPPIVLFLTNKREKKNSFRVNLALYFFFLNLLIIPIYLINNLLTSEVFNLSLTFLPALILGVVGGNLLAKKLNDSIFRKITLIILLIMGFMALISSLNIL